MAATGRQGAGTRRRLAAVLAFSRTFDHAVAGDGLVELAPVTTAQAAGSPSTVSTKSTVSIQRSVSTVGRRQVGRGWLWAVVIGAAAYGVLAWSAAAAATSTASHAWTAGLERDVLTALSGVAAAAAYAVVLLGALAVLVWRVRAIPAERSAWVLMAAGASVLGLCQLLLVAATAARQATASSGAELAIATFRDHPGLAAAGLVAYPLLYAGQMRLLKQHVNGVLPSAWLDGLLAGLLLVAGTCAYAAPSLYTHFGLGLAGALALVLRPLFDLLLTLFAAANWSLVGRRADRRLVVMTGAFAALTAADTLGVARVTGLLTEAWTWLAPSSLLTAPLSPPLRDLQGAQLDTAANITANVMRLLVLVTLVRIASPAPVQRSTQMVRWSSIAGPAIVMLAALGLLWHNQVTPLGAAAVATALLALAGVGVKGLLLFREVLALADSRRLALSDDLTGLPNRRAFNAALSVATQACAETAQDTHTADKSAGVATRPHAPDARRLQDGAPPNAVALLLIDLNGFKAINDRYGHTTGDALLRWAAARLTGVLPAGALLARLGGDEFAVLLTGAQAGHADLLAQSAATAIATPTMPAAAPISTIPTTSTHVAGTVAAWDAHLRLGWPAQLPATAGLTASIGVARLAGIDLVAASTAGFAGVGLPEAPLREHAGAMDGVVDGVADCGEELLRRADVAMYRAKAAGGGVRTYDPDDDRAAQDRARLLDELREALAADAPSALDANSTTQTTTQATAQMGHLSAEATSPTANSSGLGEPAQDDGADTDQIVVHYQPQVDLRTGLMSGVEALVRWRHPRLGLLAPGAFLDLAEEHGLVAAITTRVLRTAAADASAWHTSGHRLRVAVNLSTSCLVNPALLPLIDDVLTETGVEPGLLVMEVTETTLMSDPKQALATAHGIRARGVQLSIDDYGTGYSSLAYLATLPATELKLDRSFTARLTHDAATAAIVASTVDLAHRLGLRLLAEGLENTETLTALTAAGCDESQGYLHARPAPAAAVTRWLADQQPTADIDTVR